MGGRLPSTTITIIDVDSDCSESAARQSIGQPVNREADQKASHGLKREHLAAGGGAAPKREQTKSQGQLASIVATGCLLADAPLKWSVCRSMSESGGCGESRSVQEPNHQGRHGRGRGRGRKSPGCAQPAPIAERVSKRLRTLRSSTGNSQQSRQERTSPVPAAVQSNVVTARLHERATVRLDAALGGGAEEIAAAVAKAFLLVYPDGSMAKRRMLALTAALRANASLRKTVLDAGVEGAEALAKQEPHEWAHEDLKSRRLQWAQESLRAACPSGGEIGTCPECGGRAVVECGQSADFKKAKQYAHYTCLEEHCGKISHIKE